MFSRRCRNPDNLASIQIDVGKSNAARTSGNAPADIDMLVESFKKALSMATPHVPSPIEISVRLLDPQHETEIIDDATFWPRIFLEIDGTLVIRARNQQEALSFLRIFGLAISQGYFRDHSSWATSMIEGGTPHLVSITHSEVCVRQVVAKIALGLLGVGGYLESALPFDSARRFVLGETDEPHALVRRLNWPKQNMAWSNHHVAAVFVQDERIVGVISIFGDGHVVDLGPAHSFSHSMQPVVAICRANGASTKIITGAAAESVLGALKSLARNKEKPLPLHGE
jgi:hypothetical protein